MYLRFVTASPVDGMAAREGFFQAAGTLANDPETDAMTVERIDALRQWFADNLDLPDRFSRRNSKGGDPDDTKGLSWFKPTARAHISKAYELKTILEENGYGIDVLKENRIGYVTYEDDIQIVAEPFADTRR